MNNTTNTVTYADHETGHMVTYANNEWAWVKEDSIASYTTYSTAVQWWRYEAKYGILTVQYKNNDTYYKYEGVPFYTVFAMLTADSLGAFIAREVKPHFSVTALAA